MAVGLLALPFNVTVFADKIPEVPTAVTMEVLKGSMKASPTLAEDGTIQLNNAYCSIMVRKKVKKKRSFIHDGVAYRLCCNKCLETCAAYHERCAGCEATCVRQAMGLECGAVLNSILGKVLPLYHNLA